MTNSNELNDNKKRKMQIHSDTSKPLTSKNAYLMTYCKVFLMQLPYDQKYLPCDTIRPHIYSASGVTQVFAGDVQIPEVVPTVEIVAVVVKVVDT